MEVILLVVFVVVVVVVVIKTLNRDPDLETLSADQMARQVRLLQNWIKKYDSLPSPPDDLKKKYAYKKQRLDSALVIWGRKIKEAQAQELMDETDKERHGKTAENEEVDDIEGKLEQELNELEENIRQADPISISLIGNTLEMLQKGFFDRHGSFDEFSKKGGDLGEYVNLLIRMSQDYKARDSVHGEWASRICAVHASAAYIEKRELEMRAKMKIDEVISEASKFDGRA